MARSKTATIVDLGIARGRRRIHDYEARVAGLLDQNRGAISRLFSSGSIFTRRGSRTGRDLLLAQQHLLRLEALLARLEEMSPETGEEVERVYVELDALLAKTSQLTARSQPQAATRGE